MKERPWMICGTGPTFFAPDPAEFRICALNRAILHLPSAEVCAISHIETLLDISHVLDERAETLLMGDPMLNKGGPRERVSELLKRGRLPVKRDRIITSSRTHGYPNGRKDLLGKPLGMGLCHERTVATLAISYLVQAYDIKRIGTCGVDGGTENHALFKESYAAIPREGLAIKYDQCRAAVELICEVLDVKWWQMGRE